MSTQDRARLVLAHVRTAAEEHDLLGEKRGAGEGNRVTNAVMARAGDFVRRDLGEDVAEQSLTPDRQRVDFWLADEGTIIEVEFSLTNPYPCLQKDLVKALLALDSGHAVRRLVLIGRLGSVKRHASPAPQAIIGWAKRRFGIEVEIWEI